MRIALYTDADIFAGTERHMLDLARGLREEGADPILACPAGVPLARAAAEEGFEHLPIEKIGRIDRRAIRTLRRELRTGGIGIVHAHNGRTALQAAIAVRLARRGALVVTQHFIHPSHTARRGIGRIASRVLHRWVHRCAGRVVAISGPVREAMLDRGDASAEKIAVVHNGMRPPGDLPPSAAVREELGVGAGAPLIVCAARLQREKSLGTLVDAMAAVTAAHPEARCVIAGEGAERPTLEHRIAGLGLGAAVKLPGFRDDVMSIISAADLFVLPSAAEAFGLVLIEAMSLGRPVVAVAAGGPLDIVEDGETGLLVPPGDPAALARAITELIESPDVRHRMGRAGRARFEQRFTNRAMVRSMIKVYHEAMDEPRAAAPVQVEPPAADPSSVRSP